MKSFKLIGLALGASFALSASAFAQDITVAVAATADAASPTPRHCCAAWRNTSATWSRRRPMWPT